ncbi:hypothetical protein PLICRDRAFT_697959 [Plicaturopsis crispa FD-325 SS-3]|nr:hypothetical protein PLICRDRAFT_697959 [Plicaturopsis crispa FD-325 SS-3]
MNSELDLAPSSPVLQIHSLDLVPRHQACWARRLHTLGGLFPLFLISSLTTTKTFDTPSSPGLSLLALPGADTDDDLVPPPPEDFSVPPSARLAPTSPSKSLLLIDDPNDLGKMNDLRKRAVAAERAARNAEAQYTEQGVLGLHAEARYEKERRKEVGALLQLKLGGRASSTGDMCAVLTWYPHRDTLVPPPGQRLCTALRASDWSCVTHTNMSLTRPHA